MEHELPFGVSHEMIILLIALAVFIFLVVISQSGQIEKALSYLLGNIR